jgi:hypothetical protein
VNGFFTISNVRPGDYNLFAWVPGFVGDYRFGDSVKITSGSLAYSKLKSFTVLQKNYVLTKHVMQVLTLNWGKLYLNLQGMAQHCGK